jgi:hypothetical protein
MPCINLFITFYQGRKHVIAPNIKQSPNVRNICQFNLSNPNTNVGPKVVHGTLMKVSMFKIFLRLTYLNWRETRFFMLVVKNLIRMWLIKWPSSQYNRKCRGCTPCGTECIFVNLTYLNRTQKMILRCFCLDRFRLISIINKGISCTFCSTWCTSTTLPVVMAGGSFKVRFIQDYVLFIVRFMQVSMYFVITLKKVLKQISEYNLCII